MIVKELKEILELANDDDEIQVRHAELGSEYYDYTKGIEVSIEKDFVLLTV